MTNFVDTLKLNKRITTNVQTTSNMQNMRRSTMKIHESAHEDGALFEILSNLYSEPNVAVIREFSSNAIDSHIKAGQTQKVKVTLPTKDNPHLVIQDWGVGMSAETLLNDYLMYGYSDKKNSLDQKGSYGMGAKSAMAITSQFSVTAVKDGMKTVALIVKEETSGVINIVAETPTDEPNGVTVSIPVSEYENITKEAETALQGFDPESIEVTNHSFQFLLDTPLKTPDNMYYFSNSPISYATSVQIFINVGGDAYNVTSYIREEYRSEFIAIRDFGLRSIIINMPIGSIHLTPSRDQIKFDNHTVENIKKVIDRLVSNLPNNTENFNEYFANTDNPFYEALRNTMENHPTEEFRYYACVITALIIGDMFSYTNARGELFSNALIPQDTILSTIQENTLNSLMRTYTKSTNGSSGNFVNRRKRIRLLDLVITTNYSNFFEKYLTSFPASFNTNVMGGPSHKPIMVINVPSKTAETEIRMRSNLFTPILTMQGVITGGRLNDKFTQVYPNLADFKRRSRLRFRDSPFLTGGFTFVNEKISQNINEKFISYYTHFMSTNETCEQNEKHMRLHNTGIIPLIMEWSDFVKITDQSHILSENEQSIPVLSNSATLRDKLRREGKGNVPYIRNYLIVTESNDDKGETNYVITETPSYQLPERAIFSQKHSKNYLDSFRNIKIKNLSRLTDLTELNGLPLVLAPENSSLDVLRKNVEYYHDVDFSKNYIPEHVVISQRNEEFIKNNEHDLEAKALSYLIYHTNIRPEQELGVMNNKRIWSPYAAHGVDSGIDNTLIRHIQSWLDTGIITSKELHPDIVHLLSLDISEENARVYSNILVAARYNKYSTDSKYYSNNAKSILQGGAIEEKTALAMSAIVYAYSRLSILLDTVSPQEYALWAKMFILNTNEYMATVESEKQ